MLLRNIFQNVNWAHHKQKGRCMSAFLLGEIWNMAICQIFQWKRVYAEKCLATLAHANSEQYSFLHGAYKLPFTNLILSFHLSLIKHLCTCKPIHLCTLIIFNLLDPKSLLPWENSHRQKFRCILSKSDGDHLFHLPFLQLFSLLTHFEVEGPSQICVKSIFLSLTNATWISIKNCKWCLNSFFI
jgi:hypothetical protein